MHQERWIEQDGYVESLVSLKPGLGTVLRVRAVRNGAGKFEPVVRDFTTGIVVASTPYQDDLKPTMARATELARGFLEIEART